LEEEGKSPSMKHLKSILQQAKGEGAKTIFIQKEFDSKTAETIANDINGRVVVVNPLEENWLENMEKTVLLINDALNGK
jgi:zinc transport system substrate-binding protein